MKKLFVAAFALVLGVTCLSSISLKSYADCDGECEVSNGPGGSAYVFIPLPGNSFPAGGIDSSSVVKKGRIIGNNEFGFGSNKEDQNTNSDDDMIIDPTTLPAE